MTSLAVFLRLYSVPDPPRIPMRPADASLRFACAIRFLFAVFFLTATLRPTFAQWVQTNGPYGGYVGCFAVNDTNPVTLTQCEIGLSKMERRH